MKLFFFLFISISLPDYCILMDTVLLIVVCAVTLAYSLAHSLTRTAASTHQSLSRAPAQ